MMANNTKIRIGPDFHLKLKHGFHEFYVYGNQTMIANGREELIHYKRRIIRIQTSFYPKDILFNFVIWSEHLSSKEIKPKE